MTRDDRKIITFCVEFPEKSIQNNIFNKSKCAFFDEKYVRFIKILRNTVEKLLFCACKEKIKLVLELQNT